MDSRHFSRNPLPSHGQDFPLLEHLNLQHPLIVLAKLIDVNAIAQIAYEAMGARHRRPLYGRGWSPACFTYSKPSIRPM